jgi:hypothetical protein
VIERLFDLHCVARKADAEEPLLVGCHSEVEMFGLGELFDAKLHRTTKLVFFELISDQASEGIADGTKERYGACEVGSRTT